MNQVVVKQEKSGYQIVEAYKSLRTNLQFCGEDKKVIAVTSCTPNEGKSSVSMQLGISLAESGKRVILIDADLRKSVLLGRTKTQKSVRGLAHFPVSYTHLNANFSRERKLKSLASDWLIIKNLLFMCEKPFSDTL